MSLTDSNGANGMVMPVSPLYASGGYGGNGFGNDWGSLIVLFLIAALFGGFNGGFGGYGGMGGFAADGAMLYPWMNQSEVTTNGFQNLSTQNQITAVQSDLGDIQTQLCGGFADVQNSLCNGFAGVNATVNAGFANAESSANARQMANMQQAFNAQTAVTSAINGLASQQASCCCENRLATCQTQNIVQNEANATRFADANNTRDLLNAFTSGIQSLKDQLCDYRNEQKDDTIAQLRSELMYARGQASQDVQTAAIQAGQRALANEVEQYVLPTPRPAYVVQNPNCCAPNYGCGCGCGM